MRNAKHTKRNGKRGLALLLGALIMLAPLSSLATGDLAVDFVGVISDKNTTYSDTPTVNVPEGGFPENEWVDGINPLTGEPWAGIYQPIFVSVDTDPRARPNFGVSDADVIYELPLHRQGNTRSIALFMSTLPTAGAGPVRSARIPMVDVAEEWGAGYVFFGMQEQKGTSVKEHIKNLHRDAIEESGTGRALVTTTNYPYLDLMGAKFNEFNERSSHPAPHNVICNVADLVATFGKDPPKMRPWKFSEQGLDRGASALSVEMRFRPDWIPTFLYNAQTRSYDRYYNGEPFVDANNNRLCTYANVIVMRTDVSWYRNNPSRPIVKLTGQGVADFFMNGRYIRGSWVRAMSNNDGNEKTSLAARTVFLDENGQEMTFLPGKTFIHVVAADTMVIIGNDPAVGDAIDNPQPVPTPKPTKTPKPTRTPRPTRTPKPGAETPPPMLPIEDDFEIILPDD